MTQDEVLKLAFDWYGSGNQDPDEFEKLIKAIAAQRPDFGPQPGMHYGMNQDDWKDIVAAISKARDGRGIYLACRPADVFQDWFLAMGLFKPKEKNAQE
jgi:hypothetical protein